MCNSFRQGMLCLAVLFAGVTTASAQTDESPIRVFGYFQTQFSQNDGNPIRNENSNSFLLQQLNVFLQKDLAPDFSALIDVEIINTLSTSRATGALNMEEVWVRYRAGREFNLKVGLQIPIFNHLNTIKNRTPILPYVIRPLVYEESFDQIASLEEFVPEQAFVQAYGTLAPPGALRFDYALFLGNSPNERTNDDMRGQAGVDTTNTFLVGGRVGVRMPLLKFGISATYEEVNRFTFLADRTDIPISDLTAIPRTRFGADLRFLFGPIGFEGELIYVHYNEDIDIIDSNKLFYYGTLSFLLLDRLTLYTTYWVTREDRILFLPGMIENDQPPMAVPDFTATNRAPSFGFAYDLRGRVVLKGQFTRVSRSVDNPILSSVPGYSTYSLGVSVFF